MKKLLAKVGAALALGFFTLVSCTEDIAEQEHYKVPDWLKGNAYEVLQSEGNHSIFLKGIELSGFKPVVEGQSLTTVIAPNDDAFNAFLQKKGYSSIEQMNEKDPEYLKRLITYHLMYFAYDWDKMVNFRPNEGDGATTEEKENNAGVYYKHRTHSQKAVEEVRVKLSPAAVSDTLIKLYHYESYLPVLSNKLFETKGIDAKYNYEYFYPTTTWGLNGGDNGAFNIANGAVLDKENVITDNGYLYHVDHVIEPVGTVYDQIANNPKYSEFLRLYDGYSVYNVADETTTRSLGYEVFVHRFDGLPSIAMEWPVEDSRAFSILESQGYNVFAPSNTAMQNFFTTYWKPGCGYNNINDLDPLILQYFIMQSFAAESRICFPEEIKKGKVLTAFGTEININPDDVTDRVLCENGAFYGMDKMDAPAIFSSVVGPAFNDVNYINYLYTLDGSDNILSLASNQTKFVTLIPSNQQYENSDPQMRLFNTLSGRELQEYSADAGDFVKMSSGSMKNIVNMHTAQNISSLPTSGQAVVTTNQAFNYWYVKDGKITTNALFNNLLEPTYKGDPFSSFAPLKYEGHDWDNGAAYTYDYESVFKAVSGDGLVHKLAVCNDKNYEYYMFAQLLNLAGLVDTKTNTLSVSLVPAECAHFICFIPTNEAIAAALSQIPGCTGLTVTDGVLSGKVSTTNKPKLATWLRQYFVNDQMNSLTAYPYQGSECHGKFYNVDGDLMTIDTSNGVKISNDNGSAVASKKYHQLPFAFPDGCFQLMDDVIK